MQSNDITSEQAIKVSIFGVHGVFSLIHKDFKSQKRSAHGFLQYYIFLSNHPTNCLYNTSADWLDPYIYTAFT